ncbi:hypothetical protein NADFUDRAFT_71235 [Nadsonia fulvescens var. elongata DSM 6958]|uniref:Uncharacterized protein n=1 Tax=Nadsonia fulvescens var. elongata DSM 6958 TaxID=857566 RepID=A0A1E3PFC9_9ASCO|nr:hypothetical protein NADFUDRAFT_71235 [Nadsonia fulvescens var. elongata DSM 6958]
MVDQSGVANMIAISYPSGTLPYVNDREQTLSQKQRNKALFLAAWSDKKIIIPKCLKECPTHSEKSASLGQPKLGQTDPI